MRRIWQLSLGAVVGLAGCTQRTESGTGAAPSANSASRTFSGWPGPMRFEPRGDGAAFTFYVDTTSRSPRIRYRKLAR